MNQIKKECPQVVGHQADTKRLNTDSVARFVRKVKYMAWLAGALFMGMLAAWFLCAWVESLNAEWFLPMGGAAWLARLCYECAERVKWRRWWKRHGRRSTTRCRMNCSIRAGTGGQMPGGSRPLWR